MNELTSDAGNLLFEPPRWRYLLYGPGGQQMGAPQETFAACRRWLKLRA